MLTVAEFAEKVAMTLPGFLVRQADPQAIVLVKRFDRKNWNERAGRTVLNSVNVAVHSEGKTRKVTGYEKTIAITPDNLALGGWEIPVHTGLQHFPRERELRLYRAGELHILTVENGQLAVVSR